VLVADALAEEASVVVRAPVLSDDMNQGVVRAWLLLAGLGVILVIVAALATDRMGRSLVRPVTALSDAARALAEGDLDTRVVPSGPPEVAEVGEAFNLLASRLETLLREERESVADLSHRLRTPLTALRLQAETLGNRDDSDGLLADIDRVEGAVDRMIQELRRPSSDGPAEPQVADLGAVVRHRSTFWKVLADEQDRSVEVVTLGGVLQVPLSPDELGTVIDTLMENVFAHTDSGTGYRIGARPGSGQTAVLTIEDAGPGFSQGALVERGHSGGGSTGLGLDIARRAAEKTGGTFNVSNSHEGGGRVEVVFGTTNR
jgi:signal transduction histidine kinase